MMHGPFPQAHAETMLSRCRTGNFIVPILVNEPPREISTCVCQEHIHRIWSVFRKRRGVRKAASMFGEYTEQSIIQIDCPPSLVAFSASVAYVNLNCAAHYVMQVGYMAARSRVNKFVGTILLRSAPKWSDSIFTQKLHALLSVGSGLQRQDAALVYLCMRQTPIAAVFATRALNNTPWSIQLMLILLSCTALDL
jgi:hypothetical protein